MKRIVTMLTVALVMAALMVASMGNSFAQGANQERECVEDVELLGDSGVLGDSCETRVLTPSGQDINSQHFKPNTHQEDKLFDKPLVDRIIEPPDQTSGIVVTPRGNATAHNRFAE